MTAAKFDPLARDNHLHRSEVHGGVVFEVLIARNVYHESFLDGADMVYMMWWAQWESYRLVLELNRERQL